MAAELGPATKLPHMRTHHCPVPWSCSAGYTSAGRHQNQAPRKPLSKAVVKAQEGARDTDTSASATGCSQRKWALSSLPDSRCLLRLDCSPSVSAFQRDGSAVLHRRTQVSQGKALSTGGQEEACVEVSHSEGRSPLAQSTALVHSVGSDGKDPSLPPCMELPGQQGSPAAPFRHRQVALGMHT